VPNTDHSLKGSDAPKSALAFYEAVVESCSRPEFLVELRARRVDSGQGCNAADRGGSVAGGEPNRTRFPAGGVGPAYHRSALEEHGDGVYIAKSPKPAQGWVAYFIELTFPSGGLSPFKFTTGVRVAPEVLPFGPPPEMASSGREHQRVGSH
jgi:PhoPQ-activated pathogenicity-related protein